MTDWIKIGQLSDIPQRGARCINTPIGKIAVFRTATDDVFAIEDRWPAQGRAAEPGHRARRAGDLSATQLGLFAGNWRGARGR